MSEYEPNEYFLEFSECKFLGHNTYVKLLECNKSYEIIPPPPAPEETLM